MSREVHVRFCESARGKFPRATHLVVLSRGHAREAHGWIAEVMTRLGLALIASHLAWAKMPTIWHGPKWAKIRDDLNTVLRGWSHYFGYGSKSCSYRTADYTVCETVRHFLLRRHKVPSRRTHRFSFREVYGDLGVMLLQDARDAGPHARVRKPV